MIDRSELPRFALFTFLLLAVLAGAVYAVHSNEWLSRLVMSDSTGREHSPTGGLGFFD